jgi:hypothetical protein
MKINSDALQCRILSVSGRPALTGRASRRVFKARRDPEQNANILCVGQQPHPGHRPACISEVERYGNLPRISRSCLSKFQSTNIRIRRLLSSIPHETWQGSLSGNKYKKFGYEFVFEWGIPEDYILVHQVSLQTLMARGLRVQASSTENLQDSFARLFFGTDLFDIGLTWGFFARPFGARAPLQWIAQQWYYDCVRRDFDWNSRMVNLHHDWVGQQGHSERVDLGHFRYLEQGVDTA